MAVWAVALSSTELVSRRLAPALRGAGIQSLVGREPDRSGPFHPVALPPASMREAIPKDVSGRTSYYPARLEFHHVPQLIRGRFNERRCGPPQGFAPASSWSWQDRRVSGADTRTDSPCSGSLSLRLRVFPLASPVYTDSQAHSSIGTASDLNVLRHLVSTRFQDLFHSPPGVGTCSLSVAGPYLALGGGPPVFGQDFTCPVLLSRAVSFVSSGTGLSPSMAPHSSGFP